MSAARRRRIHVVMRMDDLSRMAWRAATDEELYMVGMAAEAAFARSGQSKCGCGALLGSDGHSHMIICEMPDALIHAGVPWDQVARQIWDVRAVCVRCRMIQKAVRAASWGAP